MKSPCHHPPPKIKILQTTKTSKLGLLSLSLAISKLHSHLITQALFRKQVQEVHEPGLFQSRQIQSNHRKISKSSQVRSPKIQSSPNYSLVDQIFYYKVLSCKLHDSASLSCKLHDRQSHFCKLHDKKLLPCKLHSRKMLSCKINSYLVYYTIESCYPAICMISNSYLANCTIKNSYLANYTIGNCYLANCTIADCDLANCTIRNCYLGS